MKAMILAAGLGTRLGSLTQSTPKCLIEAGGKPMLEHVIEWLKRAGVTEVVINLHYLSEQIVSFVEKRHQFGIKVSFSYEPEILGTGGGLRKASGFFSGEDELLMVNSDIFCTADLSELLNFHKQRKELATLLVSKRKETSYLVFDGSGHFAGWEKENGQRDLVENVEDLSSYAFCGVQILNARIFGYMQAFKPPFSIIQVYLEAARRSQRIGKYDLGDRYWIDMGTPGNLKLLNDWLSGNA